MQTKYALNFIALTALAGASTVVALPTTAAAASSSSVAVTATAPAAISSTLSASSESTPATNARPSVEAAVSAVSDVATPIMASAVETMDRTASPSTATTASAIVYDFADLEDADDYEDNEDDFHAPTGAELLEMTDEQARAWAEIDALGMKEEIQNLIDTLSEGAHHMFTIMDYLRDPYIPIPSVVITQTSRGMDLVVGGLDRMSGLALKMLGHHVRINPAYNETAALEALEALRSQTAAAADPADDANATADDATADDATADDANATADATTTGSPTSCLPGPATATASGMADLSMEFDECDEFDECGECDKFDGLDWFDEPAPSAPSAPPAATGTAAANSTAGSSKPPKPILPYRITWLLGTGMAAVFKLPMMGLQAVMYGTEAAVYKVHLKVRPTHFHRNATADPTQGAFGVITRAYNVLEHGKMFASIATNITGLEWMPLMVEPLMDSARGVVYQLDGNLTWYPGLPSYQERQQKIEELKQEVAWVREERRLMEAIERILERMFPKKIKATESSQTNITADYKKEIKQDFTHHDWKKL